MRQKLGQHFLKDPAVATEIASALEPTAGDTIIEVGPGHGELTQAFVAKIEEAEVRDIKVIAIEKDAALAEEVAHRFREHSFVEVRQADILEFLAGAPAAVSDAAYKLAGNIPYYLTGHLLRTISELVRRPDLAIFMLQKEVAERIVSEPPRMNRLAASVQFWAEPQIIRRVGRKEFSPPPEVDSAVLLLRSRKDLAGSAKENTVFYRIVRVLFAQPRKTILNNLKQGLESEGVSADEAIGILERCGIYPEARPQDLGLDDIKTLAFEVDKIAPGWG